jgi:hypothetical protein
MYLHEHRSDEHFGQGAARSSARPDDGVSTQPGSVPAFAKRHSLRVDARHRARKTWCAIGAAVCIGSPIAVPLFGAKTGAAIITLAGNPVRLGG